MNLDIVDAEGKVIGEASREEIHAKGLLHREVHVWFYTPQGEIIFQHRAKDKDTYPDLLDATVGGHVEQGSDYVETAVKEAEEETGIKVDPSQLKSLGIIAKRSVDPVTHKINNVLRAIYAYRYTGNAADLKVEDAAGAGFESWPIEKLSDLSETDKKKFIPSMIAPESLEMFRRIIAS